MKVVSSTAFLSSHFSPSLHRKGLLVHVSCLSWRTVPPRTAPAPQLTHMGGQFPRSALTRSDLTCCWISQDRLGCAEVTKHPNSQPPEFHSCSHYVSSAGHQRLLRLGNYSEPQVEGDCSPTLALMTTTLVEMELGELCLILKALP